MYPGRKEAEDLLLEAGKCNPRQWESHSRITAYCAEKIAERSGMDSEKAYILGLLHDIGRKFGVGHLRHVSDGYKYMMSMGYDEVARICLTHSFNKDKIEAYVGNFDASEEDTELIREKLKEAVQDDYDKLIQLCDSIAGAEGIMDIIDRMNDVKRRYGSYDPEKWQTNLDLKAYFEARMGIDIYTAVGKDDYKMDQIWVDMYNAAKAVLGERRISDYVTAGEVSAAVRSKSGKIYLGVCIDTCSTLGICAERNAIFNMITNGEHEIDRVLCIPPNEGKGAPCGACRELMVQLMPGKYKDIDIMINYSHGRVMKLGELTPEWWID